jgi:hypothetical protein
VDYDDFGKSGELQMQFLLTNLLTDFPEMTISSQMVGSTLLANTPEPSPLPKPQLTPTPAPSVIKPRSRRGGEWVTGEEIADNITKLARALNND